MAKINFYQQGQLASAAVGTPGQFTAGSQTLGNVAQGAGHIADSIQAVGNAIFGDQLAERRRREAEARAADKQIADADRASYISDKVGEADIEYTKAYSETQAAHQNNTDGAAKTFEEQARAIRERYVSAETDPLKKALVNEHLASKTASYIGNINQWSQGRQIPIMKDRLVNMAGNFSIAISDPNMSAAEVGQRYQEFVQQNLPNYQFTEGAAAPIEMRKALEPAIINYLQATALNRPELLEARTKAFAGGGMLDPSKLLSIVDEQKRLAHSAEANRIAALHTSQADAQYGSSAEVIQASPDGDPKNANPEDLVAIQKKWGPKLSPEANNRLAKDIKEATTQSGKKALSLAEVQDQQTIVKGFAQHAANEEKLAGRISANLASLPKDLKNASKEEQTRIIQQNQLLLDQYEDAYKALNAVKNSITDPKTKDMAQLHLIAASERFGSLRAKLSNSQAGREAEDIKNTLYGKVYPANMFPDAKTQATYNYFHKSVFYETLQNMNITPDKMKLLVQDQKALQAFKNVLAKKAHSGMVNFGILPH
jgi:hypothetical protein